MSESAWIASGSAGVSALNDITETAYIHAMVRLWV